MSNVLKDLVAELALITKGEDFYSENDFDKGYRMAVYMTATLIGDLCLSFGLNKSDVFGDFDPEDLI